MTTTTRLNKQSVRTYKDLLDMSAESEAGQIITVHVGPESRRFHVHRTKLGPLSILLYDPSSEPAASSSASLPNVKAETFNALVNWIYNEPLPHADSEPDDAQIEDAFATQCLLLDLMMLACRCRWEKLYNAAIDAFREGEANLRRERPDPRHIQVVYQRTVAGSPIREFMGDYAYSLARGHKNLTWYFQEEWSKDTPEFLEDMLKRVDGKGPFRYPFERSIGECSEGLEDGKNVLAQEMPLDLSVTTYHVHDGRMVLDCKRSKDGGCAERILY